MPGAQTVQGEPPPRLPYKPRPGQLDLSTLSRQVFRVGGHGLFEAGTGTGKTVAVLAAALEAQRESGRKIIWLTRTNSQARQVIREFAALTADAPTGERPLAIALQGRTHLCPKLRDDPRYSGANAEEYARLCGVLKRRTRQAAGHVAWGMAPGPDAETDDPHEDEDGHIPAPSTAPTGLTPKGNAPAAGIPAMVRGAPPARLKMVRQRNQCEFYANLLERDPQDLAAELAEEPLDAERMAARLEAQRLCPYEAAKGVLPAVSLLVVPYIYAADPRLARALQDWLQAGWADCLLVVDEAHNLPEYLRGLHSPELSHETLRRARAEAVEVGDPNMREDTPATAVLDTIRDALDEIAAERLLPEEEDALVPPDDLTVPMLSGLHTTTRGLTGAIQAMSALGDQIRTARQRAGRLPRSYLGAVAGFLAAWLRASPSEHAHVVIAPPLPEEETEERDRRLQLFCLDPSIGNRFLQKAHAVVHISGTLRPIEQYRDLLGLGADVLTCTIPSPYAADRLRLLVVDDVTTRYEARTRDPAMMDRLHDHLAGFAGTQGVNSVIFFPSHAMLAEAEAFALAGIDRRRFTEVPGRSQARLMADLELFRDAGLATRRGGKGALWLGVTGGRVAEGMDFPGATLEAAVIVGVPYPRPTARQRALVRFNEIRFDKGWEYAVEAPTVRRVLQAIGRIIRDADDRGIVFLLDDRFKRWSDHLPRLERLGDQESIAQTLAAWVDEGRAGHP